MTRTTHLRRYLFALLVLTSHGAAWSAAAQTAAPAPQGSAVQTTTLLNSGFQIMSTNYLTNSIVITLQRGNRAFLCELNFDGTTVQCVEIK